MLVEDLDRCYANFDKNSLKCHRCEMAAACLDAVAKRDQAKPFCYGKMPDYEERTIACGVCRVFDGCAVATIREYGEARGWTAKEAKR
jgi:uncharacterized CHY-type Zn-finger protein